MISQLTSWVWPILQPSNFLFLSIAIATALLWSAKWHWGRTVLGVSVVFLLAVKFLNLGQLLLIPLEDRFRAPASLPDHVDGIVVLSGDLKVAIADARGQPVFGGALERLTTGISLARHYPRAKFVYSDAPKSVEMGASDQKHAGSDWIRLFAHSLGFDTDRILFENKARNTYENAIFSQKLARPKSGDTWLLVTSAFHMPRAVGTFRRADWDVIPYPTDFRTRGRDRKLTNSDMLSDLKFLDIAAKEWIGMAVYRMLGRTRALFPGPN